MDIPVIYTTTTTTTKDEDGSTTMMMKDSGSVASSTLSNWSASFRANFPFLVRHQQQYSSLNKYYQHQGGIDDLSGALGGGESNGYQVDDDDEEEYHQAMEDKQNEILSCLNGYHRHSSSTTVTTTEDEVNLWQLRELALSRGGLLNSNVRKRAWPKLVATHDHVLGHYNNDTKYSTATQTLQERFSLPKVSRKDAYKIKHDVQYCVWHIEDHVMMAKQQQELRDKMVWMKQQQQQLQQKKRQVTFQEPPALVTTESPQAVTKEEESKSKIKNGFPLEVTTTSSLSNRGGGEMKHQHHDDDDDDDTYDIHSPLSTGGMITPNSQSYYGSINSSSGISLGSNTSSPTRRMKRKPTSSQEQQILYNVLVNVLRSLPNTTTPSQDGTQKQYHYFSGLHDLTALILINLESPSLTSLVVSKLASYHLYDSFVEDSTRTSNSNHANSVNGTTVKQQEHVPLVLLQAVLPLLEMVDVELYQFVQQSGTTLPTFCKNWITCWFAQDVLDDIRIASRLVDVFLVSHVTMPIYITVAMLTHPVNRSKILNSRCDLKSIHTTLKRLPTDLVLNEVHDPLDLIEDMIESAIQYLEQVPPTKLMSTMTTSSTTTNSVQPNSNSSTNTELKHLSPPSWTLSSTAPTDYGLLQQAKAMRAKAIKNATLQRHQQGNDSIEIANDNDSDKNYEQQSQTLNEDQIHEMYSMAAIAVGLSKKTSPKNTLKMKRVIIVCFLFGIVLFGGVGVMRLMSVDTADKLIVLQQQPLEEPLTKGLFRRKKTQQLTESSPSSPNAAATKNNKEKVKTASPTKLTDTTNKPNNNKATPASSLPKQSDGAKKRGTTTATKKESSTLTPSKTKPETQGKQRVAPSTQMKSQPVLSSVLPTPPTVSETQSSTSSVVTPASSSSTSAPPVKAKESKQEKATVQQTQYTNVEKKTVSKNRKKEEIKEPHKGNEGQPKKKKENILNKWFSSGDKKDTKKKDNNNDTANNDKTIAHESDKKGPLSFLKRNKNKKKEKKQQIPDKNEKKKDNNIFSLL